VPTSPSTAPTRLRLRITQRAESIIRSRHPWLYSDSIVSQNRPGQLGEIAIVYDRKDEFLAFGLYDPDSPIRLRILHVGKPQTVDAAWWRQHLQSALDRRQGLFDADTTGYRLCHGESDGWPGFVLDRYAGTLVLKLYTGAWLCRLEEMLDLIQACVPCERIVLRLSRNIQEVFGTAGYQAGKVVRGSPLTGPEIFQESGLRFEADVLQGQKTGFFLDQRENRRQVETLAAGRHVLNAFSFSGGFSLYTARGGAASVTDLDISRHALEGAARNFALNAGIQCPQEQVQADAFEWIGSGRMFDLIILDPPSLAKRETERERAIHAYGGLARRGIAALRPGGILVAASCSAHVSADEFFGAVRNAARQAGRKFEELATAGHPPDHRATFAEANYLKCIYLRFRG
jgi:23S rRNA (cytosine1962-C5)-methyltransferase